MSGPERWCEGCGELAARCDAQEARVARLEAALKEMLREYRDAPFDVVRRARAALEGRDE